MRTLSNRASKQHLVIRGGIPLCGTVKASGSKNASLPIMAAAILANGPVALRGVPHLQDVTTMAQTLRALGLHVHHNVDGRLDLKTVAPNQITAPERFVSQMRASFCVLGPLLATRGRAVVALPGGCAIGRRPVDLHLQGLAKLGAEFRVQEGYVFAQARKLRGTTINLLGRRGPTVTGTANVLCAATLAQGTTVIEGAAREPEVVELGKFLQAMGAHIAGLGTSRLIIEGVDQLYGTSHTLCGDRIEVCTYLLAAAITGGDVCVQGIEPGSITRLLDVLHQAGHELITGDHTIRLIAKPRPGPIAISTEPYPGVPTDVQPLLAACATISAGQSTITDRVFPERFGHAVQLARMGAKLRRHDCTLVVEGRPALEGAVVDAHDLRGGAALVLAALSAHGESVVRGLQHLDRGYEHLASKLTALGANIERVEGPETGNCRPTPRILETPLNPPECATAPPALSVATRRA